MIRDIVDKGHKIVGYSVRGIQSQIQVRQMKGYKLTDKTIEQYYFTRILIVIKNHYLSQLMRLWHFSSSVNSFFERARAAIQWG